LCRLIHQNIKPMGGLKLVISVPPALVLNVAKEGQQTCTIKTGIARITLQLTGSGCVVNATGRPGARNNAAHKRNASDAVRIYH